MINLIAFQLFFYVFFIPVVLSSAADTLAVNQSLSGDQTLVSLNGNFEMGFFRPGESPNYYIGIWYKKISTRTIVWVANRETPISDRFSFKLKIIDGNLVLLDESNSQIWSTNTSSTARPALVVLLDDGNLVLRYGSGSRPPIWQSFDHPTHTFLPGGKLGYNKRTNTKQVLTSWRSIEDPGMGLFSLELDPNNKQYLIKWNGSEDYWTSGSWNDRDKLFSLVPEMRLNYIYNYSYVDNENESYFTYSLYNPSIISRFIIGVSGQIQQLSWLDATQQWNLFWSQPRRFCEVYGGCGAYGICNQQGLPFCNCLPDYTPRSQSDWNQDDFSGGCVRKTEFNCKLKNPMFNLTYVKTRSLPTFLANGALQMQLDESACRSSCLAYCACFAYTFISDICLHWNSVNLNSISLLLSQNSYLDKFYIKVSSSEFNCTLKNPMFILRYVEERFSYVFPSNENLQLDESACRRSCLDNCICNGYAVDSKCRQWNRKNLSGISLEFVSNDSSIRRSQLYIKVASKDLPHLKKNKINLGAAVGSVAVVVFLLGLILFIICRKKRSVVGKTTMEGSLVAFAYRDLQIATKNFTYKLGGGSFGSVFKGVLYDSSIVAVKKLASVSQGEKEFRSEVSTLGIIQHVNLVRLCGFCAQGKNRLLVYDYMPNGSLNSHLFNKKQDDVLTWKTRYHIALGTARGLVYLHEKCRERIIHCDIKPENILLDADFCPRIADFGLAKLMGRDFSRVLTTMRGTRGYLAPEWLSGMAVTAKADVFSYGMMLFELVSGKRNSHQSEDLNFTFFPSVAANVLMAGGDILSLLDSRLKREASIDEVTKILKVAYWCIQDLEDSRPSMSQVEHILEGVLDVNMPPIPQSVMFFADDTEDVLFFKQPSSIGSSQVQSLLDGHSQSKSASS